MKQELAEGLLGQVMGWEGPRLAEELPVLDRMARFKYDEYQQFGPGRKFLENLGLWLRQFETPSERETAYDFVKRRLVFISEQEMRHLVEASFPDVVRPILIRTVAAELGLSPYRIGQVVNSQTYQRAIRASLFLGLSDGARMDVFRRSAGLDNEQVWQAYELSSTKSSDLLEDLRNHEHVANSGAFFERVFLIDDFSASGTSYIRREQNEWKGKVVKAIQQFTAPNGDAFGLIYPERFEIYIVLYISTGRAIDHMRESLSVFFTSRSDSATNLLQKALRWLRPGTTRRGLGRLSTPTVLATYELPQSIVLDDGDPYDTAFLTLVDDDRYYRSRQLDGHEAKGGTSNVKRGFAGCALPVALSHNCPNNSVYLLWADEQEPNSARGLFPRVARHREPSGW